MFGKEESLFLMILFQLLFLPVSILSEAAVCRLSITYTFDGKQLFTSVHESKKEKRLRRYDEAVFSSKFVQFT